MLILPRDDLESAHRVHLSLYFLFVLAEPWNVPEANLTKLLTAEPWKVPEANLTKLLRPVVVLAEKE
jgi:hypothetical protein